MAKTYSRRERVATALEHKEPDRVPCDLTISPPAYQKLCDHLGFKYEPYWWDDCNHAFPSAECLEKLNVDVCHFPAHCFVPPGFDKDAPEFRDQWRILRRKVEDAPGSFMYVSMDYPLADAESVDDIMDFNWPTPDELYDPDQAIDLVKNLYNNTDFALTGVFGGHLFEMPHFLMGMEKYFVYLYTEPEIVRAIIEKTMEIQMEVERRVLRDIGQYMTHIRLNGEDVGTQNGPLINPDFYADMIKPYHQKEWEFVKAEFHKYNPRGKLMIHTCGGVYDFIPHFIEAGCDILNPIQPNAKGMDTELIGRNYGDKLSFHGAIDSQDVLSTGSREAIFAEVKKRIRDLGPGGGYIASPSHNVQSNVPPENVVAMYEAIHEYGKYPLNL